MKKNILLLILFLTFALTLVSCNKTDHIGKGWDEYSLLGKPKIISIYKKRKEDKTYEEKYKEEVTFSELGRTITSKLFLGDTGNQLTKFSYSSTDTINHITITAPGLDPEILDVTYEYSNDFSLIMLENVSQIDFKNTKKPTIKKYISKKLVSKEYSQKNGIRIIIIYDYDENGRRVSQQVTLSHPEKYSDNTKVTELITSTTFLKFDHMGNWIEGEEIKQEDEGPIFERNSIQRIITYY